MGQNSSGDLERQARNKAALRSLGVDEGLAVHFGGTLIGRDAPAEEYDAARKLRGLAFDAYPSLVAICAGVGDVTIAMVIARAGGLAVVCRSGGHSTAGYSVLDDALVVDLRLLTDHWIDEAATVARFGAGLTFFDINIILGACRVHIPGGACNTVCVGGFMQGGGYGFTSRIFGMNIDSVRSFRMMLADGRVATASREVNYDLFWAVRGGTGNNFGMLLDVEYDLHRLDGLHGFGLAWDFDVPEEFARVPGALATLQTEYMLTGGPGRFGYMLAFRRVEGRISLLMRGVFQGAPAEARAWLEALQAATGGREEFHRYETYKDIERIMMEQYEIEPDGIAGAKEDKQSGYVDRLLTVAEWGRVVDYVAKAGPVLNFVVIEPYGGRIAEIGVADSAFVHRSVHMNFYVDVWWFEDEEKAGAVAWLDRFMALMAPCFNGMTYQNYPRATFKDWPLNYWGLDAYTELVAIKRKYDPEGFFTFPQAIGRWSGFQPSGGIGDAKLAAAIRDAEIVAEGL